MLICGLGLGILAIILGAFGAHAFKRILSEEKVNSFEVGVRYQMYAALTLLFLSQSTLIDPKFTSWGFYGILIGTLLFSGSIYLLAFKDYWQAPKLRFLGPITPLGGLLMILGWLSLLLGVL